MRILSLVIALLAISLISSCSDSKKEIRAGDANMTAIEDSLFERGEVITSLTFDSLRTHLMAAMASGGPQEAVNYCNLSALTITASLEREFGVTIKRAATQNRNPLNKATEWESSIIEEYSKDLSADLPPKSRLFKEGNKVHFVKPIFTLPLCLQCHGKVGETMTSEMQDFILSKYPEDQATGYGDKELRGIWHITFE